MGCLPAGPARLPRAACVDHRRHLAPAQEDLALQPSALASLHAHRRVLGVIGIMHCPSVDDIGRAYAQFEQRCK